jgi:hypothetical protein
MTAPLRFAAIGGQHDARSIRLQDGLDPVTRNLRLEQGRRATQLSEIEHRYF